MDKGIFQYVWRYSKKEQMFLGLMAAASFPFYFIMLDVPKMIVDDVLGGKGGSFSIEFFDFPFGGLDFPLEKSEDSFRNSGEYFITTAISYPLPVSPSAAPTTAHPLIIAAESDFCIDEKLSWY